jgi:hypothetical protein
MLVKFMFVACIIKTIFLIYHQNFSKCLYTSSSRRVSDCQPSLVPVQKMADELLGGQLQESVFKSFIVGTLRDK